MTSPQNLFHPPIPSLPHGGTYVTHSPALQPNFPRERVSSGAFPTAPAPDVCDLDTPPPRNEIITPAGLSGPPVVRSRFQQLRQELPGFVKKNRGLATNPDFWRMLTRLATARMGAVAPPDNAPVMFVATHHKVMTTYFNAVLRLLAFGLNRRFQCVHIEQPDPASKLVLSMHGKLDLAALGPYRGIHIMRDPRDMIVSGYHYHKWTHEAWVHRLDESGVSYQEKLNRANTRDGLFMEIDHFIFFYRATLDTWNTSDPDVLEVAYEDLMGPEKDTLYKQIFGHVGLSGDALALAVDLMRLFEAKSRTGRRKDVVAQKSHVRSGRSGQWRNELEPEHLAYIEQELGPVLRKFGYPPP